MARKPTQKWDESDFEFQVQDYTTQTQTTDYVLDHTRQRIVRPGQGLKCVHGRALGGAKGFGSAYCRTCEWEYQRLAPELIDGMSTS